MIVDSLQEAHVCLGSLACTLASSSIDLPSARHSAQWVFPVQISFQPCRISRVGSHLRPLIAAIGAATLGTAEPTAVGQPHGWAPSCPRGGSVQVLGTSRSTTRGLSRRSARSRRKRKQPSTATVMTGCPEAASTVLCRT